MRERLAARLREFGIRAQLPKLELPKLAALAELVESHVQSSDTLGRGWLKSVLLSLVVLFEQVFESPTNSIEHQEAPQDPQIPLEYPISNLVLFGHHARVIWCCFRN